MPDPLAIHGGKPVRSTLLPYARHSIGESDIACVVEVLRSSYLTTGPKVAEFENSFARWTGASCAVAVSSGTAALHAAMFAIGIGEGDEVIVPAITFAATANAVLFQRAIPVFADVQPDTLLIDPQDIAKKITTRTKAVVAVDYAGQPADYDALRDITTQRNLALIADAAHSLGAQYKGRNVGTLADLTAFSFHPVKHVTTGEGGMITTPSEKYADRMRAFRNHGMTVDHHQRAKCGSWFYEIADLGWNYRLTDFQCALGISQLNGLARSLARRRQIASQYDLAFSQHPSVLPLKTHSGNLHAYHLYVIRLPLDHLKGNRSDIFSALYAEGIGVNVHYIPVHLHPYYQRTLHTRRGDCPNAEQAYEAILSLPMFPDMSETDVQDVIQAVLKVTHYYSR